MEDGIALISNPPTAGIITELDTMSPRVAEEKAPASDAQWKQVISAAVCIPLLAFYVASLTYSAANAYALSFPCYSRGLKSLHCVDLLKLSGVAVTLTGSYNKPFAIAWTATFFYWIALPIYVLYKYSQHLWQGGRRGFDAVGLLKRRTMNLPSYCIEVVILSFLWLFELYFFSAALLNLPPSSVLLLWQGLSAALILALSVALLGVRTQLLIRLGSLLLSVGGVAFITLSSKEGIWSTGAVLGVLFTLFSVVSYSIFATAFKLFTDRHSLRPGEPDIGVMVLMLAGMGAASLIFLPVFFLLHISNIEVIALPSYKQLSLFSLNNFLVVGTNLSFALCVGIVSPLFTSIASMLALPLTSVVDFLLHDIKFTTSKIIGTGAIFVGFAAMLLAEHLQRQQRRTTR